MELVSVRAEIAPSRKRPAAVVTLDRGTGMAVGFADLIVFNADAKRSPSGEWGGRFGQPVCSERVPAYPELIEARRRNSARIARDRAESEGQSRQSRHFTEDEISELLGQYRETVARCVTIYLKNLAGDGRAMPACVDRKDIEGALLVELAEILGRYLPQAGATLNTYVWGCLCKRVVTVAREVQPFGTVPLDLNRGYPEGGFRHGARTALAKNSDDIVDGERTRPRPTHQRFAVAAWRDRQHRRMDVHGAEDSLGLHERRVLRMYHREDMSQKDIARALGMSQPWVSKTLASAEEKFRKFFDSE